MRHIHFVIITGIFLLWSHANAQTACSSSHGASCLSGLRTVFQDRSAFWFGFDYGTTCPGGPNGSYACVNMRPDRRDSLLSRMTGRSGYATEDMQFVVNVTYSITLPADGSPRTYPSCGFEATAPLKTPQMFSIDPLNPTMYEPFDVRELPEVTWPSQANTYYTVAFYDAGNYILHGLYINAIGGRLHGSDAVEEHFGPGNPIPRENAYVWAVFTQPGMLSVDGVKAYRARLAENGPRFYFEDLISAYALTGPVGANFLRMTTDGYAARGIRDFGIINRCPLYYGQWLSDYLTKRGGISYFPTPLPLSVSVEASFKSRELTYGACCKLYHQDEVDITVDYKNWETFKVAELRDTPTMRFVPIEMSKVFRDRFERKRYTLLLLDPSADLGSTSNPETYVHWMIVNIPGSNVTSGDVIYPWILPLPDDLFQYIYVFMLFEQTTDISTAQATGYSGSNCHPFISGRCQFRAGEFIADNGLSLVGMKLMHVVPDSYWNYFVYDVAKFATEKEICSGQPGYPEKCSMPSGVEQTTPFAAILISTCAILTAVVRW